MGEGSARVERRAVVGEVGGEAVCQVRMERRTREGTPAQAKSTPVAAPMTEWLPIYGEMTRCSECATFKLTGRRQPCSPNRRSMLAMARMKTGFHSASGMGAPRRCQEKANR